MTTPRKVVYTLRLEFTREIDDDPEDDPAVTVVQLTSPAATRRLERLILEELHLARRRLDGNVTDIEVMELCLRPAVADVTED